MVPAIPQYFTQFPVKTTQKKKAFENISGGGRGGRENAGYQSKSGVPAADKLCLAGKLISDCNKEENIVEKGIKCILLPFLRH